mgnify:CR=1 FL=1
MFLLLRKEFRLTCVHIFSLCHSFKIIIWYLLLEEEKNLIILKLF